MSRQDQNVAEGGQAIQASRDVIIHQGLSVEDMVAIMNGVEQQVQRGIGQAEELVRARLDEFKQSLHGEFARPDTGARMDAFADPDFQYALHEAQKGFVRSGEEGLKEELVKLLAQRSAQPTRTRTAHILNEAIQTIGSLTPQEISALVTTFIFAHLQILGVPTIRLITAEYKRWLAEFAKDYPDKDFSFEYLSSMRCATINQFSSNDIWAILTDRYDSVFTRGFILSEVPAGTTPQLRAQLFEAVPEVFDLRHRFKPRNRTEIEKVLADASVPEPLRSELLQLNNRTKMSAEDFKAAFLADVPELEGLTARWDTTLGKATQLTGLGKAIAHSALASRTAFSAPLSIWVS